MYGIRFLSAFLKVNPYFTVVLAVAFTGVAAIGVKQSDTASLKNLIPLHIKSIFSQSPPDKIVTVVPGIEDAHQRIHELLKLSSVQMDDMDIRSALTASRPDADSDAGEKGSLAALIDPFGFALWDIAANQPGSEAEKRFTNSSHGLPSSPSEPDPEPEVNSPQSSRVVSRFTSPFPISVARGSPEPEIPIIFSSNPISSPPPAPNVPPNVTPIHPGGGGSGGGMVEVPEPPAGFLFAGSLVMLGVLYRSGVQRRASRIVS